MNAVALSGQAVYPVSPMKIFFFLAFLPCLALASYDEEFRVNVSGTEIQVATLGSPRAPATLVYLPGFSDTYDNHETLLRGFAAQGYHVIALDYPGHGQSGGNIRWWSLKSLAGLVPAVLADPRAQFRNGSPIVLAGWSTGGTIAIRTAQAWQTQVIPEGSTLAGIIAFTPALPARIVINVNADDLTDGSMKHGPQPNSVPVVGAFATSITVESKLAALESVPSGVPTLVLVAGTDEDRFAFSGSAVRWVKTSATNVRGFQCPGAKHGLEFEPSQGATATSLALRFSSALRAGDVSRVDTLSPKACPRIEK